MGLKLQVLEGLKPRGFRAGVSPDIFGDDPTSPFVSKFDIALQLPIANETLTIQGAADRAGVLTTFSRRDIDGLPLTNGRTLQSLIALVPGIVVTDSVGTLAQYTSMGQRRFSNRLTVDGVAADLAIDVGNPGIGEAGSGSLPALSTLGSVGSGNSGRVIPEILATSSS